MKHITELVGSIEEILRGEPLHPANPRADMPLDVFGCNPTNQC